MRRVVFLTGLAVACLSLRVAHADPQSLGAFQAWHAYASHDGGQDVCYMSTKPAASAGTVKKRGAAFAEVTDRPAEHHLGVFDILAGYSFKPGVPVTLEIGKHKFSLFTHGDAAFAQDADDSRIVAEMHHAASMVFTGTTRAGTVIKDTFSLKGADIALAAINKACKVSATATVKPTDAPQ